MRNEGSRPTVPQILDSLAERFCQRKAYRCLLYFLRAYFAPNGLTDGWEKCLKALKETRALCRDELIEDEKEDIRKAIGMIGRMLVVR